MPPKLPLRPRRTPFYYSSTINLHSPRPPINTINMDHSLSLGNDDPHDAEAALEALRAAIGHQPNSTDFDSGITADDLEGDNGDAHQHEQEDEDDHDVDADDDTQVLNDVHAGGGTGVDPGTSQQAHLERTLQALTMLGNTSQQIVESMNLPGVISNLVGSLKVLVETQTRQRELVRGLVAQLGGGGIQIDPALMASSATVSKSDYDSLKYRYDTLIAQGGSKRKRKQSTAFPGAEGDGVGGSGGVGDDTREGSTFSDDKVGGTRKKRSMKLEHLVHKMANRRLGVEYLVSGFDVLGHRELPHPSSVPLSAEESLNGVQEFRPDFTADATSSTVKPFLDQVTLDCIEAWEGGVGIGEEAAGIDRRKIGEAVNVYWTRLCVSDLYTECDHR
jgi:hypothetical protein